MNMMKNSRQRDAVIRILQATTSHPTAEWIYEKLKEEFPNASLATVYRNLKVMKENGLARELYTDDSSRFDANMTEHHHFFCKKCGRVFDIFPKDGENSAEVHLEGFKVENVELSIYGVCDECLDEEQQCIAQ